MVVCARCVWIYPTGVAESQPLALKAGLHRPAQHLALDTSTLRLQARMDGVGESTVLLA